MTLEQIIKIHQRLSSPTDFCMLWVLYKYGPLYTGDIVNFIRLNSPDSSEEEAQNMANQVIRRNVSSGLVKREKTERLRNQPGRSSTIVRIDESMLQYYIQSFLVVKDPQLKVWADRYIHMEKTGQLFRQKYR